MISHLSLTTVKSLSPSVTLKSNESGFEFLIIEHQKCNAAFTLHGGHLIHFQRTAEAPIIWLSKDALFDRQKAIRGGVPICWPWFGKADSSLGDNLPSHGFARTSLWSVGAITESSEGVEIELTLKESEETLKLWPYSFELTLKASLTDQLELALITQNNSKESFNYRSALHTYLNISAVDAIQISGLSDTYCNSLTQSTVTSNNDTLLIDQAIDSIYQKSPADILLLDKQFERTLTISNTGNDSEVVWNPWINGAQSFTDMPDDGYQTMLCIESCITNKTGQSVAAGERHRLTTLIK